MASIVGRWAAAGCLGLVTCACLPPKPTTLPPAPTVDTIGVAVSRVDTGQGVAGARVQIDAFSALTGASGLAELVIPVPGRYVVTVEADGFEPYRDPYALAFGSPDLPIALRPRPPPIARPVVSVPGGLVRVNGEVARFVSGLTLLVQTPDHQGAFLRQKREAGFNGVRVFAGALPWANQTPAAAVAALPGLVDRAELEGLAVEVTALTNTTDGYDAPGHVRAVVAALRGRQGVLIELANEVGHATQLPTMTEAVLREWGHLIVGPTGLPWAIGASAIDEECPPDPWTQPDGTVRERPAVCRGYAGGIYPASGGTYVTAHLDRGRDWWNQFRRVRELAAIRAVNNEPSGCAAPGTPGQRYFDPAYAYAIGLLDRGFNVGGVHHSQAGLLSQIPSDATQQQCEHNYVAGHQAINRLFGAALLTYFNVGFAGGPLRSARFVDDQLSADGVVRAYAFVSGDRGVLVLHGEKGDPGLVWANGWRRVQDIGSRVAMDGRTVRAIEIAK